MSYFPSNNPSNAVIPDVPDGASPVEVIELAAPRDALQNGQRRYRWIFWALLGSAVLAITLYAAWPLYDAGVWSGRALDDWNRGLTTAAWLELAERVHTRLLEGLTILWLFFVGASFGSFLNVVVYRLPRGETLWGTSRCPQCGHAIRLWHNVPVLGWLWLSGACYDCRRPISPRYPWIEALVGFTFLLLAAVEWIAGGANLPVRPVNYYRGIAWSVFDPQWDLIGMLAFHFAVLMVLLSATLIEWDGYRVTKQYYVALVCVVGLVSIFPGLHPVPCLTYSRDGFVGGGLVSACCGMALGMGLGSLWGGLARRSQPARVALFLSLVGAALGWQAVLSVAWIAALLFCVVRLLLHAVKIPFTANEVPKVSLVALWLATAIHLLLWRELSALVLWPGPFSPTWVYPLAALGAILLASWASDVAPAEATSEPPADDCQQQH